MRKDDWTRCFSWDCGCDCDKPYRREKYDCNRYGRYDRCGCYEECGRHDHCDRYGRNERFECYDRPSRCDFNDCYGPYDPYDCYQGCYPAHPKRKRKCNRCDDCFYW